MRYVTDFSFSFCTWKKTQMTEVKLERAMLALTLCEEVGGEGRDLVKRRSGTDVHSTPRSLRRVLE